MEITLGIMMRKTLATLASLVAFATPVVADGPVVVELYTSQGCSSCPPADALLRELATRPDVIALALHVDYWDYIGWEDSFGNPAHTKRQQDYARVAGASTIYTPQMVIGGQDHVVGAKPMTVADVINEHRGVQTGVEVDLTRNGSQIDIYGAATEGFSRDAMVQVIRYSALESVDIRRGENAGRELTYANVVTSWDVVADWDGQDPLHLTVDMGSTGPVVVIIQEPGPGAILAAAQLR